MGSSPTKPHINTGSITNTPLHKEVKSPGEHPENDLCEQRQLDLKSPANASDSDMSIIDQNGQNYFKSSVNASNLDMSSTDHTGQNYFKSSVNASNSDMSSTDQTGKKDTELVPAVDQRDRSRKNHSSPSLTGEKRCKLRRMVEFPSRNIYYTITWPKDYKSKRPLLKPFLSSLKIFQRFDYSTRNKCWNSLVCRTIIACPVVLGPRKCSDSGLISHVNGFPWTLMEHEVYRVLTFLCYPVTMTKSPLPLARSGFVYVGDGETDRIICFFCLKTVENWQASGGFEEFHEVTCHRRMTSDDASMIDMAALMDSSATRLRLPSGSSVDMHALPEDSGPQPNLTQILLGVRFTHLLGSTADEAPTGGRATMGAEATLVDTRTSVDEQIRQGEASLADEATTYEEAELTVEALTEEEAELAAEAMTDEEAESAFEAPTDQEAELADEATIYEEAELTVEALTEEEAEWGVEATTNNNAESAVEAPTNEEAGLADEATADEEPELTVEALTDEESELAVEATTDDNAESAVEAPTDEEADLAVQSTTDAPRVESSEGWGPLSGEVMTGRARSTDDLSFAGEARIGGSRTTETVSLSNNISSVRRRASELTNIMEVIQENEMITILTSSHAPPAANKISKSRRRSFYSDSPIIRPRMTRRGSV